MNQNWLTSQQPQNQPTFQQAQRSKNLRKHYKKIGVENRGGLHNGALLLCPCLFHPSDNMWCSGRAYACQRVGSAKQVSQLSLRQNKHGQNITTPSQHLHQ